METPVIDQTPAKPVSDAESFAEHKALRTPKEPPAPAADDKQPPKAKQEPVSEPKGESAGESGTPKQESQEPKGKTAEARAAELASKGRYEEAAKILEAKTKKHDEDIADLRKKLEQSQVARPAPEAPKPAEPAKPDATSDDDPKPRLKDFVSKLVAGETYEDAQEKHYDALRAWDKRQDQKAADKTERERQSTSIRETVTRKIGEARGKYADFDQVTASNKEAGTGLLLSPAMQQFAIEHPQGLDVVYELGKKPDEYSRIKALSPTIQLAELGVIAKGLAAPASGTPETPKAPPVSKAPPVHRPVSGTEQAAPKDTAEATSYAEHKRLRQRKGS